MMYGKDKAMAKGGMAAKAKPAKGGMGKPMVQPTVNPAKGGAVKKGMSKGGMVKKGKK